MTRVTTKRQGQGSVLQEVNLTANSEGGADPNIANEAETKYSDEQDVSLFISRLYDVKNDETGIPKCTISVATLQLTRTVCTTSSGPLFLRACYSTVDSQFGRLMYCI